MEWLRKAEDWLDGYGKPGWIAAMVLAFIVLWPVGLAILGYMLWSGRMGCRSKGHRRFGWHRAPRTTGNSAFDAYREETLRRLEDEREAFTGFLDKLRHAKDKAEFDQFQNEYRQSRNDDGAAPA
ncbi:MAG: DUF2852 domain-containing protein [Pseudomonadota bacterium]